MTIEKDSIYISSREIASLTKKEHKNVKRDIENALGTDTLNFERIYLDPQNRKQTEYILPKNIALGIVSGYSFKLRMKIINRLEKLEEIANKPLILSDKEIMNRAFLIATNKVEILEAQIKTDKPLVSYATSVKATVNSVLIRDWSKSIGLKEKNVRHWLWEQNFIYKNKQNKWCMYANEKAKKYFEAIPVTSSNSTGTHLSYTIKIRGEGQTALTELVLKDLIKKM